MNYAKIKTSDRLRRVLKVLKDRKLHSTRDLIRDAHVCAVNSIVSELRMNGQRIICKRIGHVWFYGLV